MQSERHDRALAVFDAFLRYARGTEVTNAAARVREGTGKGPQPRRADDDTNPGLAAPPADGDADEGFGDVPTRESPVSEAIASSLAPLRDDVNLWDEPTRERLEVVSDLRGRAMPDRPSDPAPVEFVQPTASIIVDEDVATPAFGGTAVQLAEAAIVTLSEAEILADMLVLLRYGHARQVPLELDRWARHHADDLQCHLRLAEFCATRIEPGAGLDLLFGAASRALDRGTLDIARRVLDQVQREAPADLRVAALRERLDERA